MMSDPQRGFTYWIGKNYQYFAAPIVNGKTDFTQKACLLQSEIPDLTIRDSLELVEFKKDDPFELTKND
tara:strand:+ start:160 stop:366 length:207 start_codon:yes stop_codon:yes gene_type:complete